MSEIIRTYPVIEEILNNWRAALANDFPAYYGHVYRVFNYANRLTTLDGEGLDRLAIAACFHDLGIWSDATFDYLKPSKLRADNYLCECHKEDWQPEVGAMIEMHHKITRYQGRYHASVEAFRRADLIDLSFGAIKFGIKRDFIKELNNIFANNGFHKKLVVVSTQHFFRHPLNPFPMMRL